MGLVQYFETFGYKFYEKISGKISYEKPVIGQFCWAPVLHIDEIPQILDVERKDPRAQLEGKFIVRNMKSDDFRSKDRLPLKLLKLRDRQEAVIRKASKRPCVVLHYGETLYGDIDKILPSMGRKHLQRKKNMVILPLYGVHDDKNHLGGFPPIMVARIRAMMFDQFLFFPKDKHSPLTLDSIGRIDDIQVTINNHPSCDFESYKVTEDYLSVILSMIKRWFNLEIDEDFEALVKICNEACPDEALPKAC
jgi:hypothetical protein